MVGILARGTGRMIATFVSPLERRHASLVAFATPARTGYRFPREAPAHRRSAGGGTIRVLRSHGTGDLSGGNDGRRRAATSAYRSIHLYLSVLGAMLHRDSLGVVQRIEPGAVNWMTAGRGVVHSERIPADIRDSGQPVEGIQMWLAAPGGSGRRRTGFPALSSGDLATDRRDGARLRACWRRFPGAISPVRTEIPTLCVSGELKRKRL